MQVRFAFLWKMSVLPLNQVLEKIKTRLEFKLKKKYFLSSASVWGGEIRSIFQGTNIVEKWHRRM